MDLVRRAKEIASILSALAHIVPSGGGGGGSSDFVTATITFEVSGGDGFGNTYSIYTSDKDSIYTGVMDIDEVGLSLEGDELYVVSGTPQTRDVFIYQGGTNKYVMVTTVQLDETFVVTGDAEAVTETVTAWGVTGNLVKVYGDCTISTVGSR